MNSKLELQCAPRLWQEANSLWIPRKSHGPVWKPSASSVAADSRSVTPRCGV